MQVLLHVGLMDKRAVSNVVVMVVLVALVLIGVSVVWITANRIIVSYSPEVECSDFELGVNLEIEKACYLSDNEILVRVKRSLKDFEINSLVFGFDSARFKLENKNFGCDDVREEDLEYGRECSVVGLGETKSYIFKLREGESDFREVELGIYLVGNEERLCSVEERKVFGDC